MIMSLEIHPGHFKWFTLYNPSEHTVNWHKLQESANHALWNEGFFFFTIFVMLVKLHAMKLNHSKVTVRKKNSEQNNTRLKAKLRNILQCTFVIHNKYSKKYSFTQFKTWTHNRFTTELNLLLYQKIKHWKLTFHALLKFYHC